jgi:hypothetical protein
MAAGDIFANMYINLGAATFDIQPAVGTNVLITWVACSNHANNRLLFKNSSGSMEMPDITGTSTTTEMRKFSGLKNMKCFITNSQYLAFQGVGGGSWFSYSGIEV